MGQYYQVINLDKRLQMSAHSYDSGVKLMEHSWVGNHFMAAVTGFLAIQWKGDRIVWAGDYADAGLFIEEGYENMNLQEYADHAKFRKRTRKFDPENVNKKYPIIVDHDLKQFVDIRTVPESTFDGWHIHPLSLLTASGNGRGGGDYHGTGMEYVGTWAGHHISVESEVPEGYQEIKPDFVEGTR